MKNIRPFVSYGFTLVELMTVVVIIGILAAIAVPNFISMRVRALEASLKANMHSTHMAVEEFCTLSVGVYPGDIDTRVDQVSAVVCDKSLAGGCRMPPFPEDAMLKPHPGFKNPFNPADVVIDNLLISPPVAVPPSGCTYYSSYQNDAVTPSEPGQPAYSFRITGYGRAEPLQLVLP